MRKTLLLAALLLAIGPALATNNPPNPCGNHGNNCTPEPPTTQPPSNTNSNTNGANAGAAAGAAAGAISGSASNATGGDSRSNATGTGVGFGGSAQGGAGGAGGAGGSVSDSGNSANLNANNAQGGAGGNSSANGFSGVTGSGNSETQVGVSAINGDTSSSVDSANTNLLSNGSSSESGAYSGGNNMSNGGNNFDASDRSSTTYESQALFLPSIPPTLPPGTPGATASVHYGQCGPLKAVASEQVDGTYIGLFRKHKINLGRSDRIVLHEGGEYISRTYPDGTTRLFGNLAVRTTAVLNVAGSRQIALGGGKTGGDWGASRWRWRFGHATTGGADRP